MNIVAGDKTIADLKELIERPLNVGFEPSANKVLLKTTTYLKTMEFKLLSRTGMEEVLKSQNYKKLDYINVKNKTSIEVVGISPQAKEYLGNIDVGDSVEVDSTFMQNTQVPIERFNIRTMMHYSDIIHSMKPTLDSILRKDFPELKIEVFSTVPRDVIVGKYIPLNE